MDEFGGRDEARARHKEEYQTTVNNAQAELNGIMREIDARQDFATGEDLQSMLQAAQGGGQVFSQALLGQTDTAVDEKLMEKIEQVDDVVKKMTDAKKSYLSQLNYLNDLDNMTNDMFDVLVQDKGYSLTEARAELPAAVPELISHVGQIRNIIKPLEEAGEKIKTEDYLAAYEKYINDPALPLKPIHRDLLKSAWLKYTLRAEESVKRTAMEIFGSEIPK
jgi:hypothetical protein